MRLWANYLNATSRIDEVHTLATDMKCKGLVLANHLQILLNKLLIYVHTLDAA